MKSASTALNNLLNSSQFIWTDLYTFTFVDGSVARYTSADIDIVSGGNTFSSKGPRIQRGRTRVVLGLEVDDLDLKLMVDSSITINGQPWTAFANNGGLDGALISVDRAFMATWGDTSAGTINLFTGRVADIQVTRTQIDIKVRSVLELLNINLPRNTWQPACVHTLYDGGCGILKSSFTVTGIFNSGSTKSILNTNLPQANGYFDQGVITITSGALAGLRRTVKKFVNASGVVTVTLPFPSVPAPGDAFEISPGCDKTQATCKIKFANDQHFKGQPYIPVPETSY